MKWSWKLTRLAGIDVYVHATFFILIAWIGLSYWQVEGNLAAVISGVGFILALFGCVVLHELGHAVTARRYGIRTLHITLLPIGGIAAMERMPDDPRQEIAVALAGPAVNLVIAFGLWLWLAASSALVPVDQISLTVCCRRSPWMAGGCCGRRWPCAWTVIRPPRWRPGWDRGWPCGWVSSVCSITPF
jgi:Zn-dependent protease